MEQESLVITEFTDSALQPYRLKFFVVRDHLWDGNSLRNCSLLGFVPLKALDSEGLSAQRVWHSACHESESSVRASRSRAIHYKINDDVCGFHPVLYATLDLVSGRSSNWHSTHARVGGVQPLNLEANLEMALFGVSNFERRF